MLDHEYETMRAAEDRHWWYVTLHQLAWHALEGRVPAGGRILDAGCGTGGMLAFLRARNSAWHLDGIDASPKAVSHCLDRGLTTVRQGGVHELPFNEGTFDAVVCLDVLYHERVEETRSLEEIVRVLKPGGVLVLNLPAFNCLRGSHDVAVCGVRRYKACHVRSLLEGHTLKIEMMHYWNAWPMLPMLLWRWWSRGGTVNRNGMVSDVVSPPTWLNSLLMFLAKMDAHLCHRLGIPFGSSVFALARLMSDQSRGEAYDV